jgi:hypothetical protein
MKILRRHFFIALLPLAFGLAASWGFAFTQDKCGRLVGPVFAPKCHWIQLEYQLLFQSAGTLLGCLVAVVLGTWLELRSRRAVQGADLKPGAPS